MEQKIYRFMIKILTAAFIMIAALSGTMPFMKAAEVSAAEISGGQLKRRAVLRSHSGFTALNSR